MAAYSSIITLIQPAIGIAIRQPIRPNAYIPIMMEIRIITGGKPRPLPWTRGAIMLFSIC